MNNWKSQAPAELTLPSSVDAVDHFTFNTNHKQPHSAGAGPQFPILTPESLLSPVDPGFLDGSSPLARFGLDIGGTLCKVVYFEPAVDFLKDGSRTSKLSTADASAEEFANGNLSKDTLAHFARLNEAGDGTNASGESQPSEARSADSLNKPSDKVRNGCYGNGIDRKASSFRVKEDNAIEMMTVGVDQLTLSNTCPPGGTPTSSGLQNDADRHVDSSRRVQNENKGDKGWQSDAVSESCQCSCGTPGVQGSDSHKEEAKTPGRIGGGEDDQNSRRRAKKIWVSSHEPVHLPGRGTLYFKCFETWRMEEFLNLTRKYNLMTGGRAIGATGGGARKFGDQFLEIAGLQLQRADELKSLVRGIDFLARHAHQESFTYPTGSYQGGSIQRPWEENSSDEGSDILSEDEVFFPCTEGLDMEISSPTTVANISVDGNGTPKGPTLKGPVLARLDSGVCIDGIGPLHPYLVVNIGSGVSILRVDSPDKFERVGGTSLGGSTFLGLANALTGCQSFEEAISLAMQGDSTNVDMLVGDIYGGDYTEMGLAATTVASSFGKLVQPRGIVETQQPQQPQHLAKAALLMVTNNIGSLALLHARNAGVHSVMFTGSFLHNNKLAMRLLAVAMEFWSKGSMEAVFLRHEGHAGAMGALLNSLESSNPLDALLLT